MSRTFEGRQQGVTLIEVLISVLILAVGLLGAAAIQLNALKYTDSSLRSSQASFIAYDMMDRIRANPDAVANYALGNLAAAPTTADGSDVRVQDLFDFAANIRAFGGASAGGSIVVVNRAVTVAVTWDDSRAARQANTPQTFSITSRIAVDPVVTP